MIHMYILTEGFIFLFQVNEILNLAILSGREQVYPIQIYAVDDSERFKDVTQQTKCHSVEVDVLKVIIIDNWRVNTHTQLESKHIHTHACTHAHTHTAYCNQSCRMLL